MNELKINHLAAVVSVVLLHALGFLWYGVIFGELWMSMLGMDRASMEANAPGGEVWVLNLITIVASVYILAWLLGRLNISSGVTGAGIGFTRLFACTSFPP